MADNNELSALTPHEAAGLVGVGVQSIRRWCEWHAIHLSSGASPGAGIPRRLTGRDIEVLKQVKDLRYQGLQTDAINDRLAQLAFPEIDTDSNITIDTAIAPHNAPDGLQQAPGMVAMIETVNAVQRRLEALERSASEAKQGQRDNIIMFGFGFIAAALMFLLLIVLAWLYGG